MSIDRIAQRAAGATARRLSKPVTFDARIVGEFGQTDDPDRHQFTVPGIYTSASDAPDLNSPGRSNGIKNRVVLAQDEIDLEPSVVASAPWRPERGDTATVQDATGAARTFPIASVYPDGQGGLRIVLDRKGAA